MCNFLYVFSYIYCSVMAVKVTLLPAFSYVKAAIKYCSRITLDFFHINSFKIKISVICL